MDGQNPADHILIYRSSERQVDLLGNLGASPGRITPFHIDHSVDQVDRWALGSWFHSPLWRKQQSILSLNQSAMKTQQGGWLKQNRDLPKPTWPNPERTESGNKPISDAQIRRPSTRTVQDQQLVFGQNGLCDDSA
jgi:hypothetical protein